LDAWTAADDGHRTSAIAEPPVRPAGWPTPDVLRLIHHRRIAAGLAERPSGRAAERPSGRAAERGE
jgi:hypothetical protein